MLVYFAHPIDQARRGQVAVDDIMQTLTRSGCSIYRPGGAFTLTDNPISLSHLAGIQNINQAALDRCDALLAWLPTGVPTLGVPAEIEIALSIKKPVVILVEGGMFAVSVQLNAWLNAGASVETWNDGTARRWEARPAELRGLLITPPTREMKDVTGFDSLVPTWVPGREVSGKQQLAWTGPGKLIPGKYQGDAGLDLAISQDVTLASGEYKLISTSVHVAIPEGFFGLIIGRSSTWAKHRCSVVHAVIDSGYRGELMVGMTNHGQPVTFRKDTRLAQLILLPTFAGDVTEVNTLPESHRGHNGYGSTGA